MDGFLGACLQLPTGVFTIVLGIVVVYWLLVLVGALDVDLFGGDASGAAKGIGDVLSGGKAVGDVLSGGKAIGDVVGAGKALGGHDGILDSLGLASVPITVSGSVVAVSTWALSMLGMHYGKILTGGAGVGLGLGVFVGSLVVGLPLAGLLVRPLRPLFQLRKGKANLDYVGSVCTVTTLRVDGEHGQATLEEGGTVLVIPVRLQGGDGSLKQGEQALIIDFDPERHVYLVEPARNAGLPSLP